MSRRSERNPMVTLETLLASDWLWGRLPQVDRSGGSGLEDHRRIVRGIVGRLRLAERSVWDAYGSGDASFADLWLYRDAPAFRRPRRDNAEHSFTGLWVALCLQAPCCVMGEGEVSWSATHGSRYMPSFQGVDQFVTPEVSELAKDVERLLADWSIVRLARDDVAELLPEGTRFATNLSQGPLRIFDALFFWDD